MRTFETEQKYRLIRPLITKKRLVQLGAKKIGGSIEHNELLDLDNTLRKKSSLLRLRRSGKKTAFLTFKGPRLKGRYKKRLEVETLIDYDQAKVIFGFLGFKVTARYTKRREEFKFLNCKVAIDYLAPIGWFLEVEGKPNQISEVAKKLSLRSSDREDKSYLALLKMANK